MIELTGNLLTDHKGAIAHGVNCQGLMGAGIAKSVRAYWPNVYDEYFRLCEKHELNPGDYHLACTGSLPVTHVYNVATQFRPGKDATYPALLHGMLSASMSALKFGFQNIGIPRIGCGIGGLSWEPGDGELGVKYYLESIESLTDIEFVVYTL